MFAHLLKTVLETKLADVELSLSILGRLRVLILTATEAEVSGHE